MKGAVAAVASKGPTAKRGITPPHLSETTPTATLPQGGLADHGVYSDVSLAHAELVGQAARDVTFDTVHFKHVRLGGTLLSAPHLRDVRFDTCDFAEAAWDKAQMTRIEVIDSRLLGFKASEALIQDALF
jgi:uncharacterized protein YjbI with pentapeptide repeats